MGRTAASVVIALAAQTAALATALLVAPPAAAQERVQETVVVTGTAMPLPFESLARTVRVITREELAHLPVASVVDALRLAAGVDVRARGTHGMQTDFSLRGATFGQTLVLIDGIRVNNSQTGHHNGDLPVSLEQVERIEVLLGPGSSLYGADAFGGTINIVTRQQATTDASLALGSYRLVSGSAQAGFEIGEIHQTLWGSLDRSDGFMFDRDFRGTALNGQTKIGNRTSLGLWYSDREFGANGFYGNSPSREWTEQWMADVNVSLLERPDRALSVRASYRTFHDRFLWDVRRPDLFENTHRTDAASVALLGGSQLRGAWQLNGGVEQAADWIRSSNLGDHDMDRTGGFVEVQGPLGPRTTVGAGLRLDRYTTFGTAWSPSISGGYWVTQAVRARASIARAFRVPTFTERYYVDPAHQATSDLRPETAWGSEVALDWVPHPEWLVTAAVFDRDEEDVIDWVKATPPDKWQTRNIRRVETRGLELGARRVLGGGATLSVDYAFLDVDAAELDLISKYTLDYARQSFVVAGTAMLWSDLTLGGCVAVRQRTYGDTYTLVDLQVSRRVGDFTLFANGTNLLDAEYEEIRGVAMPGRWLGVGLEFHPR